jgi:hypothetical protein
MTGAGRAAGRGHRGGMTGAGAPLAAVRAAA